MPVARASSGDGRPVGVEAEGHRTSSLWSAASAIRHYACVAPSASLTQLLRADDDQMWRWLRGALLGRGVDPAAAALAESCEQGDDSEFGVVVAADGEVFQFAFVAGGEGFTEWVRITDYWRETPYRESVADAQRFLGRSA